MIAYQARTSWRDGWAADDAPSSSPRAGFLSQKLMLSAGIAA